MRWIGSGILLIAAIYSGESQNATAAFEVAAFEVASIKHTESCEGRGRLGISASPGRLSVKCQTVDFLIREAYLANGRDPLLVSAPLYNQPIKGTPHWATSDRYTIEARAEGLPVRDIMLGPMMRTLLEDRFKLRTHSELKEVPVYALTVTKAGPRLEPPKEGVCSHFDAENPSPPHGQHICGILIRSLVPGSAPASLYGATVADFCRELSRLLNRTVVDKTEIAGLFDIHMDVSQADLFPNAAMASQGQTDPDAPAIATDPKGSALFTAVQKLGLRLEPSKGTAEFLILDHIEKPSGN
jgi:uncharacterized protein (TIGR03435 family)